MHSPISQHLSQHLSCKSLKSGKLAWPTRWDSASDYYSNVFIFKSWAGDMACWAKMLTSKLNNMHLTPSVHMVEGENWWPWVILWRYMLIVAVHPPPPQALAHASMYTHTHARTHAYMHTHIHTCALTCIHTLKCIYTATCLYTYTHMHTYSYMNTHALRCIHLVTCLHIYICMHTYLLTCVHRPVYTQLHVYMHAHIHMYTHMYVHIYMWIHMHIQSNNPCKNLRSVK